MPTQVGIIYGKVGSTTFDLAVSDPGLRRHDYIEIQEDGRRVLGQIETLERRSNLSFEDAMSIPEGYAADTEDKVAASVRVIGYRDQRGLVQVPRTPFRAGTPVLRADENLVAIVLGLETTKNGGAYLGHVKGSRIPVHLNMDTLAQKHLSVLAKTGAGKSYTVGVVLEEFLKAGVPLVILDPHGEYGSLRNPNMEDAELETMVRFKMKPKSFQKNIREFALDTTINRDAERLVLEGMNLEGREIVDMLGGSLSGGQVGVLYQAIKEIKDHLPAYTLRDVMDGVARNKSSAKWNVLNALEVLESTRIFDIRGTPVEELVKPGQCTIINLKGVNPDIQEVVVTRIAGLLWGARKRAEVPAHILVVEEAHNFCPERNVGNAVSGAILRTVASEGRKFGMGLVIVSQRPAKIDKNVLSQCNTQIVLKVTNPNDLKAIGQSVENITSETQDEIQRLPIGVALVAGGGLTQPVLVDVRPRMTRHGGRSVSVLAPPAESKDLPRIAINKPVPDGEEALVEGEAESSLPPPDEPRAMPRASELAGASWPIEGTAQRPEDSPPPDEAPTPAWEQLSKATGASASPSNWPHETVPETPEWPNVATPVGAPRVRRAPRVEELAKEGHVPVETPPQPISEPPAPRRLQPNAAAPGRGAPTSSGPLTPPAPDSARHNLPPAPKTEPPRFIATKPPAKPKPIRIVEEPSTPMRKWSAQDRKEIHRVAARIGLVSEGFAPELTVDTLTKLARSNGRNPDQRLGLYRDIAAEACHTDAPACIRCPLIEQCQYHGKLQQERQKARSPIRRLWNR